MRRHYVQVFLDGDEGTLIDRQTFEDSRLSVGDEVSDEQWEALRARSAYDRAHSRALYLLGMRDYSCRELEKKLLPEASPEIAAAVVARLREVGLLDDENYARRLARDFAQYRQYPRRRIVQELCRRGVERSIAEAAVEDGDSDDVTQAVTLLRRKYAHKLADPDDRRRTAAALARRGFSYATEQMDAPVEEDE